jgi:uncharacterized protein (TIGR00255 family)
MRSMTAFGTAKKGAIQIEIHSVNRKTLDMTIVLPRNMLLFDVPMRKWLSEEIRRGQVTVRVMYDEKENLSPKASLFKPLKAKWDKIAHELGLDPKNEVGLDFLIARSQEETFRGEPLIEKELKSLLLEALKNFVKMREKEGGNLSKDLFIQLKGVIANLKKIEAKIPSYTQRQTDKLKEKLKAFSGVQDEEKILKETIGFIKKIDVHEEIVRFYSHVSQIKELVGSQETTIGRTLDILLQEMAREVNTLMAKMEDTEITKLAIGIKSFLNKMQEQVQNIE